MSAAGFAFAGLRGCPQDETPSNRISVTGIRLSVDILRGDLVDEVAILATVEPEHGSDKSHAVFLLHNFEALNANSAFKAPYFEMYVAVEKNNLFQAVCHWKGFVTEK
jgi:hypothetical protein